MRLRLFLCVIAIYARYTFAFYVPGVAPKEFSTDEEIPVKAIKLTSVRSLLPYEYYSLPFCKPAGGIEYKTENLGEILRGDRIVNTPYKINMRKDEQCRATCSTGGEKIKMNAAESSMLHKRILQEYHAHLLVDNLPCATRVNLDGEDFYDHGYKLGYLDNDKNVYVNNHLQMVLYYHQEPDAAAFRVVGFEVEPRSMDYTKLKFTESTCTPIEGNLEQVGPLKITDGKENDVVWTYSVRWERSDVKWASRWDNYLRMRDVQIHWFSIVNSIVVILCLSGFLSIIIIRTVRRDIAQYNKEDDLDEALEETGWKLVHGDVFRPPPYTMLLTSLVGTGIQLFAMGFVTISFAMLGMLSPSSRGSLMSVALFLYCFMGLVAGYYSGRLYKTLKGVQWKRAAFWCASLFPAIIFGADFVLNFFLWGKQSSGAVPFTTMLVLCLMWLGIDTPLVFTGFYFGYRKHAYEHPVRTNQIPRQVPEQPWYLHTVPCTLLAGILPFGAMFIELFFILSAIWENQFYYLFGFLFLVFIILVISCAQIAIVVSYFQLCTENYHWWWKSYIVSGGSAFYVFAYSLFYYYTKLEIVGFIPTLLYFCYSLLMSLTFWLMTGSIGFFASYFFICRIYGAVKID